MSQSSPEILRPIPRRPFDLTLTSATPPSDSNTSTPQNGLESKPSNANLARVSGTETPNGIGSRTRSILNLTSSTLFGIYSPTYADKSNDDTPQTPFGTRSLSQVNGFTNGFTSPNTTAEPVPIRSRPRPRRMPPSKNSLPLRLVGYTLRSLILFALGSAYGLLITHLHNEHRLAPFAQNGRVGLIEPSYETRYLLFWGLSGIAMGTTLPWFDGVWEEWVGDVSTVVDGGVGKVGQWMPVVRSGGAFVGIAFAIRKLPWTSTLQISLTLALVNPFLWYLIDRSVTGFVLSTLVAMIGTTGLMALDSTLIPNPLSTPPTIANGNGTTASAGATGYLAEAYRSGKVDSAIWVMSVLFCAVLCFGHIGRRLALLRRRAREKSE